MPLWIVLVVGGSILVAAGLIWVLWLINLPLTRPPKPSDPAHKGSHGT